MTSANATPIPDSAPAPLVGIIMGSQSDWPTMKHGADVLDALGVPFEARIVSAHRTPQRLYEYARRPRPRHQGDRGRMAAPPICRAWPPP